MTTQFNVRALQNYTKKNKREISFKKGAVITVTQSSSIAYYGILEGKKKEGWFPKNVVQVEASTVTQRSAPAATTDEDSTKVVNVVATSIKALRPSNPQKVLKEGFLVKMGAVMKSWKERWFVLTRSELCYYSSPKDKKVKGKIPMRIVLRVVALTDAEAQKFGQLHCFGVITKKRTFYMSANTSDDKETWLRFLVLCLASPEAASESPSGTSLQQSDSIPSVSESSPSTSVQEITPSSSFSTNSPGRLPHTKITSSAATPAPRVSTSKERTKLTASAEVEPEQGQQRRSQGRSSQRGNIRSQQMTAITSGTDSARLHGERSHRQKAQETFMSLPSHKRKPPKIPDSDEDHSLLPRTPSERGSRIGSSSGSKRGSKVSREHSGRQVLMPSKDETASQSTPSISTPSFSQPALPCATQDTCSSPLPGRKGRGFERLSHYQLGELLGRGAFGSVYKGLDITTGMFVAIKQINTEKIDKAQLDSIETELALLQNLSHENIVKFIEYIKTDRNVNFIMEYVENGSLSYVLSKFGQVPEKLVARYIQQVLHGLAYLHSRDVIHRDIKCANILTTKEGKCKLSDFGVATKFAPTAEKEDALGSPYWMAPEIIQLEGGTTASDIWSLGCTILELVEGSPPYSDMSSMQALYRMVEDDHPPFPEEMSPELEDMLKLCLQKDPALRPSAEDLLHHPFITGELLEISDADSNEFYHSSDEGSEESQSQDGYDDDEDEEAPPVPPRPFD